MHLQNAKWWVIRNAGVVFPTLLAPLLAAEVEPTRKGIESCSKLLKVINNIADFGGAIVLTIAIVVFLIGAFYLLFGGGSEEAPKKGRAYILYGAVGIVVAIVAFSLPQLVKTIIGIELPQC